ncbi:hypothetical protein ACVW1A_001555 [Bradyrhizobium sp. LB1.3]
MRALPTPSGALTGFWAAVIVMLLIVSALPYFLGPVATLPVLGHANWHLYRRIVVPVAEQEPDAMAASYSPVARRRAPDEVGSS